MSEILSKIINPLKALGRRYSAWVNNNLTVCPGADRLLIMAKTSPKTLSGHMPINLNSPSVRLHEAEYIVRNAKGVLSPRDESALTAVYSGTNPKRSAVRRVEALSAYLHLPPTNPSSTMKV